MTGFEDSLGKFSALKTESGSTAVSEAVDLVVDEVKRSVSTTSDITVGSVQMPGYHIVALPFLAPHNFTA